MGQKTNPNIFRIGKTKTWDSQYFEKKTTEASIYAFKNIEIKKFVYKFFKDNGFIIRDCKIYYSDENSLNILVSYYLTFGSISLITSINKKQNITFIEKTENETLTENLTNIESKEHKIYPIIKKNIKNYKSYQDMSYFFNVLPKSVNKQNHVIANKVIDVEKKSLKIRRVFFLKHYKEYLTAKNHKNIKKIEANKFIEKFFEVLHLFINKRINIFLTVQYLNKNVRQDFDFKRTDIIKRKLVSLKRYEQNKFFEEGVNALYICTTQKNTASLLAKFISTQLQKLKRHNFFLKFVKATLLTFTDPAISNLQGVKIIIKGRFNRAPRAKRKILNIRKGVPNLTINSNINYSEETSFSSNGTFGVKVWTCEK